MLTLDRLGSAGLFEVHSWGCLTVRERVLRLDRGRYGLWPHKWVPWVSWAETSMGCQGRKGCSLWAGMWSGALSRNWVAGSWATGSGHSLSQEESADAPHYLEMREQEDALQRWCEGCTDVVSNVGSKLRSSSVPIWDVGVHIPEASHLKSKLCLGPEMLRAGMPENRRCSLRPGQ